MSKPRVRIDTTGRISFPQVVQYRLQDGRVVNLPPTPESHPDQAALRPIPLSSAAMAKKLATGGIRRPGPPSMAYTVVVHDLETYERLAAMGALSDPRHSGRRFRLQDNRPTGG